MNTFFLRVFILVAVMAVSLTAYSQIENISIDKDSTFVINKVYAGILNTVAFRTDTLASDNFYSFRTGAMVTWQAMSWMKIKTFAVYDHSGGKDLAINYFSVKIHNAGENLGFEFGRMGTLATESRPLPPTAGGHFETWTEAQIPGASIGAKANYKFNGKVVGLGVNERGGKAEYQVRFSSEYLELNSYYSIFNKRVGASTVIKVGRLYNVVVYENVPAKDLLPSKNTLANFTNFTLSKKHKIDIYLDAGYQFQDDSFERLEGGFIKNFTSKYLSGLIAVGYQHETETVNGYLFIHL